MSRDYVEKLSVKYAGWDGVVHKVACVVRVYMGERLGGTYRTVCPSLVFGDRPPKVDLSTDDVSCMTCLAREPL